MGLPSSEGGPWATLTKKALVEPSTWVQADGSPGSIWFIRLHHAGAVDPSRVCMSCWDEDNYAWPGLVSAWWVVSPALGQDTRV